MVLAALILCIELLLEQHPSTSIEPRGWGLVNAQAKEHAEDENTLVGELESESTQASHLGYPTSIPSWLLNQLDATYDRLGKDCRSANSSSEVRMKCGGWSPSEWGDTARPKWHKQQLKEMLSNHNRPTPKIPMETKLVKSNGGIFCYGVVTNPPEPTFDLAREVASGCDGYMFFSNFSDPARDIKKVVFGPMTVLRGGRWNTALTTAVFLPVYR
jgi:hypothetical protein